MLEHCQAHVSIQDHQIKDVVQDIICPHFICAASCLCHHILTSFLENIKPSQYVCLMFKQDEFKLCTVRQWLRGIWLYVFDRNIILRCTLLQSLLTMWISRAPKASLACIALICITCWCLALRCIVMRCLAFRSRVRPCFGITCGCMRSKRARVVDVVLLGFNHSGSHHSGVPPTPSIRVATRIEAPPSDWQQVWGYRSKECH
jgi:hypothetical protein